MAAHLQMTYSCQCASGHIWGVRCHHQVLFDYRAVPRVAFRKQQIAAFPCAVHNVSAPLSKSEAKMNTPTLKIPGESAAWWLT